MTCQYYYVDQHGADNKDAAADYDNHDGDDSDGDKPACRHGLTRSDDPRHGHICLACLVVFCFMVLSRFRSIPMRRTGAFAPCLARCVVLNLQVRTRHWVGVVLPSLSFICQYQNCPRKKHIQCYPTRLRFEAIIYLSNLGPGISGGETVFPAALDPLVEGGV